jgi:hypothetical protein
VNRPLALVTGASSGIGRALALRFAAGGHDVVLVARDGARLEETAAECRKAGISARTIVRDLSKPGSGEIAKGLEIDALVHNAGFGVHGPFSETELGAELGLIGAHCDAVVELTKAVLPGMLARRRGGILTIGSVYSFAPVPEQALYAATKAFQLSFSRSLSGELAGTGVHATMVCPGITRTEFRARAGMRDSGRLKGRTPEEVAEAAYRAFEAKKRVVVLGGASRLFVALARFLPGGLFLPLMSAINRYRGLSPAR